VVQVLQAHAVVARIRDRPKTTAGGGAAAASLSSRSKHALGANVLAEGVKANPWISQPHRGPVAFVATP
jgi:hypothetical protein